MDYLHYFVEIYNGYRIVFAGWYFDVYLEQQLQDSSSSYIVYLSRSVCYQKFFTFRSSLNSFTQLVSGYFSFHVSRNNKDSIFTTFKFRSLILTSEKDLSAPQFLMNGTDCHLNWSQYQMNLRKGRNWKRFSFVFYMKHSSVLNGTLTYNYNNK